MLASGCRSERPVRLCRRSAPGMAFPVIGGAGKRLERASRAPSAERALGREPLDHGHQRPRDRHGDEDRGRGQVRLPGDHGHGHDEECLDDEADRAHEAARTACDRPRHGLGRRRACGARGTRLSGRLGLLGRCGLRRKPDLALGELFHLLRQLVDAAAQLRRHGRGLGALLRRRLLRLRLLLGLTLELGQAHAQVGQLVRQAQALGLHRERPKLCDLLRLALEAVEHLAEKRGERVLRAPGLDEIRPDPGAGQERGGGAPGRGSLFGVLEQPVPDELRAGNAPAAVPDDRAERATLHPPGDRLPAEPRQIGRFGDGVRPQDVPGVALSLPGPGLCRTPPGAGKEDVPRGCHSGVSRRGRRGRSGYPAAGHGPERSGIDPARGSGPAASRLGAPALGWGQSRGVAQPG